MLLWYGISNSKTPFYKLIKKRTNKYNKLEYIYNFSNYPKSNNKKSFFMFYVIPNFFHFVYIKNKKNLLSHFFIWSKTYYLIIPIPKNLNSLHYNPNSRTLFLNYYYINNFSNLYNSIFMFFYNILFKPFFTKIKFKGKGYYLYKNYRNTLTPQFGYSHRLYLYTYFLHVIFLSKTNLIFFGLNYLDLKKLTKLFYNWRPINIFTGRGVRFARQIIYKKSGKISTYR